MKINRDIIKLPTDIVIKPRITNNIKIKQDSQPQHQELENQEPAPFENFKQPKTGKDLLDEWARKFKKD